MKGWLIILFFILIGLITSFIPVAKSTNLVIGASYFNVYQNLNIPSNWKKWQPGLKSYYIDKAFKIDTNKNGFKIETGKSSFQIERLGLNNFSVDIIENNKSRNFEYLLMPDLKTNKTRVMVIYKVSLLSGFLSIFNNDDLSGSPISELKRYMEDVNLYYGFTIYKQQAPRKLLAVKQESTTKHLQYDRSKAMLHELTDFINKNHLKVIDALQYQIIPFHTDSLQILIGYPVDKQIKTGKEVIYMDMPRGKTLVGIYKGKYNLRSKLYDAMHLYMQDNYVNSRMRPFEKFANNKLPGNDTALVDMQVVFPCY